ncbi:MAG: sn-glycerol-1-phosphate dehydrogenase [Clostridia bacterium]|nr:sn-glycerol-1-phosphate dehydrogenase [Clostridia bacterium]
MEMNISALCNRVITCSCGHTHFCPIEEAVVCQGALERLPSLTVNYQAIFMVADDNTWAVCGDRATAFMHGRVQGRLIFQRRGRLVPDERAVEELESALGRETDLIIGIGSGVINDICKYVSWKRGIAYGIVATAPSMDGYASSGAAMIVSGMKVTYTTHPPRFILADTDVVKNAPMDMIRAGYGDIIGKYSSLNDWKLSHLVTGEYFCQEIYDLVMEATNHTRDLAERIVARDGEAIGYLTKALILIGITLSLLGSTRPGSGSEHHLSHFFEIVGLLRDEPYFSHGTDVAYSTVVTADIRERINTMATPAFHRELAETRLANLRRIYGRIADEIIDLQTSSGSYERDLSPVYREKWPQIQKLLDECPSADECRTMLTRAGYRLDDFVEMYGSQKIHDAMYYGKDLKNRYSVLWLYYDLFSGMKRSGVGNEA